MIHIDVYELEDCGACMALENDLNQLEQEYPQIYIRYLDLDDSENLKSFKKLKLPTIAPTIIVEKTFVKQGYNANDKDLLKKNIQHIINHQPIHYNKEYRRYDNAIT
ncbi:hypothetical protein [Sharpea porci]|uniref:hypothetical protein n=1 Tax=Sharpea porci TaxID=2652286 RepID=UPI0024097F3B|nr:hypothetical protein [Sharpea porci]MDD6712402.1 hypothetical protein [Sharpea porci]MDY5280139.1 hypothetical protein [Sharpea porci]